MRIGVLEIDGQRRLCAFAGETTFYDLAADAAELAVDQDRARLLSGLRAFLDGSAAALELARTVVSYGESTGRAQSVIETRARFLAPVAAGATIFGHVVNYSEHAAASERASRPFVFPKLRGSVVGHRAPIEAHSDMSLQVDWEAELGVVIGEACRDVTKEEALAHVAGYTIVNDVSHRALQFNQEAPDLRARYGMNWVQGKGLDGSCPVGPWIVTADDLPGGGDLRIASYVNGQRYQEARTSEMHFDVSAIIAEVSRGLTLRPGDLIATGTPFGTGLDSGRFLAEGDVVRCEIEGIGALVNDVRERRC